MPSGLVEQSRECLASMRTYCSVARIPLHGLLLLLCRGVLWEYYTAAVSLATVLSVVYVPLLCVWLM